MTTRKCANWLATFNEWSLVRSEAPESFHTWAGFFALASVLKRKVVIPNRVLGGWEVYPFMFTIFVAPPGKARKSTSARYSDKLLRELPTVERASTAMTKEVLYKKLSDTQDSSISIFSSEFAMFIQKSGFDMYDTLTHLFDGDDQMSDETLTRGLVFADKPCVNLLACTTPEWISNNMPESVIGGGFASRVIFVFEEKVRRLKLYYDEGDMAVDWKKNDQQKEDLISDLTHIAMNVEGEFTIESNVRSFMDNENPKNLGWYQRHMKMAASDTMNHRLHGYYERKPAHLHKLAMMSHLSYDDELVIKLEDMLTAINILEDLERKLPRTFESIGKNVYAFDFKRIRDYIKTKGTVRRRDIMAAFYHVADPKKLQELVQGLIDLGEVRKYVDPDDPHNDSKVVLKYVGDSQLKAATSESHTDSED